MNTFITISGYKLEINHQQPHPNRPTLIFLHEGLGSIRQWRDFPEAVGTNTKCNTLVYNRAGYGASDPARLPRQVTYMHDEAIGHSDGGSIALINGGDIQSPDLLGIITEAAHVFNEEITVRSIEEAKHAYQTTELREKLAKNHLNVDNTFWGWNDIWLHPEFREWNIEEYLPSIDVPLLVMQGLDDQYGTLAQVNAIVAGVEQAETILIPDCQHTPHKEQREEAFAAMTTFILRIL